MEEIGLNTKYVRTLDINNEIIKLENEIDNLVKKHKILKLKYTKKQIFPMNCGDDIDKIADEIIELIKLENEIDNLVKKQKFLEEISLNTKYVRTLDINNELIKLENEIDNLVKKQKFLKLKYTKNKYFP